MRMKQLAYAISLMGIAGAAHVYADDQPQKVEKIEITGSSIKRINKEGALPVQVISKDDIAKSGVTSVEALVNNISAFSTSGATNNAVGAGTSTYGESNVSLRGLGSDRTLVLVNGRRVAAFAGGSGTSVNVNNIPLAAIERVEVLKDGASGVYGADAVAGVINFILTKNYQGLELNGSYGQPTRSGGGENKKASLVAGFGDLSTDGFNVTASASLEKESVLFGKDRDYAKTAINPPYYYGSATGQGNIQGAWDVANKKGATVGGWAYAKGGAGAGYGNPAFDSTGGCESIKNHFSPGNTSKGAPYCQYDSAADVGLIPDRKLESLTGNLTVKLTDDAQLFADALWSRSTVDQSYQNSPMRTSFFETDTAFDDLGLPRVLMLKPSNPNYATAKNFMIAHGFGTMFANGDPVLGMTARSLGLGNRANQDISTQSRLVAGIRGSFGSNDYEFALSGNKSKTEGTTTGGYFSQTKWSQIINDDNTWNPWAADGLGSAALVEKLKAAAYYGPTLGGESTSTTFDGKVSGELFQLDAGAVGYAVGGQYRTERFILSPSEQLLSGDIAGLGGAVVPLDKKRKVGAVFGEVVAPLAKNLETTLALRSDDYDDVGRSTNYKLSARWQPMPSLLVRASVGSGFRAPTLTDLWYPQVAGSSAQFNDPATGATDIQVTEVSGGNPALKPEKSKQATLGIVVSPVSNLTVGIDLFRIKVTNMIDQPSTQYVVNAFRQGRPLSPNSVILDANGDVDVVNNLLSNIGTADVRGADLDINYSKRIGAGRLQVTMSGTYMSKYDQTLGDQTDHKVGDIVNENGDPVLGADRGGVVLRWKHALTAGWTQGAWNGSVTQNFYLGYGDSYDLDGNKHRVPSQAIYDAQVGYSGIKNLKLSVGVKNLLNSDPPLFIGVSNSFQYGYDTAQYDPRGRFVYVNAGYKFW